MGEVVMVAVAIQVLAVQVLAEVASILREEMEATTVLAEHRFYLAEPEVMLVGITRVIVEVMVVLVEEVEGGVISMLEVEEEEAILVGRVVSQLTLTGVVLVVVLLIMELHQLT
jgi:hypothetical protein